jgi:hypothetical protein
VFQLPRRLHPGEQLEPRDHRGPELAPIEFEGDPIRRRGSALQEVNQHVAVGDHHCQDLRSASAASRKDLASEEGMTPFSRTARVRCVNRPGFPGGSIA